VRTENVSAVSGRDYTAVDTTVVIPRCAVSTTVQVPLIAGATPPANATFRLNVEGITGAGPVSTSRLVDLNARTSLVALPLLATSAPAPKGRIAYMAITNDMGMFSDRDIFTVGVDGSAPRQLTAASGFNYAPDWSPDGRRIAFTSNRDGNPNLYVMNADGSGQVALTTDPLDDSAPKFSPDGSQIAFISNRLGRSLIYIMPASGGEPVLLSPDETTITAGSLSWSPDGTSIVFESRSTSEPGLFILGLDRSLRRLTDQSGDVTPAWSPDGSQIAFYGSRGALTGLYVIRPDGTGLREINVNFDIGANPSWSPDGKYLAMDGTPEFRVNITGFNHQPPQALPAPQSRTFTPAWSPVP
jgi:TolB protein